MSNVSVMFHRGWGAAGALILAVTLSGCATGASIVVRDAQSVARSARLALELDSQDDQWPPALSVTLEDAVNSLADDARQLSGDPSSPQPALDAVRAAVDAVRLAQRGDAGALTALDAAIDQLESAG